jgi:hypothetical protein
MVRHTLPGLVAFVAGALAFGGCGFKQAGSFPSGSAGKQAGGTGGAGGMGGVGGSVGGEGDGGRGGSSFDAPVIILDASTADRPGSSIDMNCGARSKTATKVAPDILILLDRSGSMNDDVNNQMCRPDGGMGAGMGCGPMSKWALITPAITQVVSETEMDVNWGLKFFPDNSANTCTVNTNAAVPVAPANGAAIAAEIMAATSPNGGVNGFNNTPTRSGTAGAVSYLQTLTNMNPKFILLATDGLPTCAMAGGGGDDSTAAVAAVDAARTAGYKTFVVGIATASGTADATLSNLANAGGLPRAGTPTYYPVTSATDLAAAIRTLIGVAATCTFQIGPAPTDDGSTSLEKINVFGDGVEIKRDATHADGYDYTDASMNAIEVHGPLCAKIMSGEIRDVNVTFQCLII